MSWFRRVTQQVQGYLTNTRVTTERTVMVTLEEGDRDFNVYSRF